MGQLVREDHPSFINKILERDVNLAIEVENHREFYDHPDKEVKKGIGAAEFYLNSIIPRVSKVLHDLGFSPEESGKFIIEHIFSSKNLHKIF